MASIKQKGVLSRLALLATTIIWGTSFVILKTTLETIPTLYILTIRFFGAALLMLLFGFRQIKNLDREYIKYGMKMGLALFLSYVLQTYGLVYTTPGKNAFLTAVYCVLVPFLAWGLRRQRPSKFNILAAFICIAGIGFVSLDEGMSIGLGDGLTLFSGLFFALHILYTSEYSQGRSTVLLNFVQFVVCGAFSCVGAVLFETFPQSVPNSAVLGVFYLCVVCTGVCFLFQTFGQKYTPPSISALLLTLESVFGVICSAIFYGEMLTPKMILGFVMIFSSIVLSETNGQLIGRKSTADKKEANLSDEII